MSKIQQEMTISAPPEDIWAVLADFGNIARWSIHIHDSELLSAEAEGVGAKRRVVDSGFGELFETVTTWQENEKLAYRIDGAPFFVKAASGEWVLTPIDDNETRVSLTYTLDSRLGIIGDPLLILVARGEIKNLAEGLLYALSYQVESQREKTEEAA